jgi:hypothetical protein
VTPNLIGRWQTRIAMLLTLGILVTLIFALSYNPEGRNDGEPGSINEDFFIVLFSVLVLGLIWDIVWILAQRLRWDRDWPPAFQWATAIIEGALIWLLLNNGGLPNIPAEEAPPFGVFLFHYGAVFVVTWVWVQGPMRALFPRWRFHGGRIV